MSDLCSRCQFAPASDRYHCLDADGTVVERYCGVLCWFLAPFGWRKRGVR